MDRFSWLLLGVLGVVALGVAAFLIPAGSDDSERQREEQTEAVPAPAQGGGSQPPSLASSQRTAAGAQPVNLSGTIERVNGHEVTIRTATGDEHRVNLRPDARVIGSVKLVDLTTVRAGDAVEVYTETVTSDAYHPPADIGRAQRIDILADGVPKRQATQCPAVAIHIGIVSTIDGDHLDVQTSCGAEVFEVRSGIPVRRTSSATFADLLPGVQVTLVGTRPPAGMIEVSMVEVLEQ